MRVEAGRIGVPSGAITKLALPQALLAKDKSRCSPAVPAVLDAVRLGRERDVPKVSEGGAGPRACPEWPCSMSCSQAAVPRSSAR